VRPALAARRGWLFAFNDLPLLPLSFSPVRLRPNMDVREGMKKPENVQQPQDHGYHYYGVQDRLDRSRHGDERIDQPQQDTHYDQNHQYL
jgi:hypothetical protein